PFLLGGDSDDNSGAASTRSHGHGHGTRPAPASRGSSIALAAILVPLFLATLVGAYLLWPGTDRVPAPEALAGPDGKPVTLVDAPVLRSKRGPCDAFLPPGTPLPPEPAGQVADACVNVEVRLTDGPDAGSTRTIQESFDPARPVFKAGDEVRVARSA